MRCRRFSSSWHRRRVLLNSPGRVPSRASCAPLRRPRQSGSASGSPDPSLQAPAAAFPDIRMGRDGPGWADYSPKLTEYNQKSIDCLNDLFRIKLKDEKYDKCIFSINSAKIHKILKFKIYQVFKLLEMFPFEYTIYMNKHQKMNLSNRLNLSKRMLRGLLKIDETSCVICLENVTDMRVVLNVQHTDCIYNDDYPCCDELHIYCCVCKEAMGGRVVF